MCSGVMGGEGRGVPFCPLGTPPTCRTPAPSRQACRGRLQPILQKGKLRHGRTGTSAGTQVGWELGVRQT